jgi:hypothetical protein
VLQGKYHCIVACRTAPAAATGGCCPAGLHLALHTSSKHPAGVNKRSRQHETCSLYNSDLYLQHLQGLWPGSMGQGCFAAYLDAASMLLCSSMLCMCL